MREIEFRIWDKKEKEMNKIELLDLAEGDDFWYDGETTIWDTIYDSVGEQDRFIIMQYTGLKDKNGVKIFEGDVVYYNDFTSVYGFKATGVVVYTQDCMFEIEYDDKYIKNHKSTRPLVCNENPIFTEKKIEVIGNIYNNPELLK